MNRPNTSRCQRIRSPECGCALFTLCVHFHILAFAARNRRRARHPVPLGSICRADHRVAAMIGRNNVVRCSAGGGGCGGGLATIGSTLREAGRCGQRAPRPGWRPRPPTDVSIAVSQLFGRYGQEFQTVSSQLAAFRRQFVRTLNRGAAAYLSAPAALTAGAVGQIERDSARRFRGLVRAPKRHLYGQLVANGHQPGILYGAWSANPFPFLQDRRQPAESTGSRSPRRS